MRKPRVLLLATNAMALASIVSPFAQFLESKGYSVCLAAADEAVSSPSLLGELRGKGHEVVAIPFSLSGVAPKQDVQAMLRLFKLLRADRFDVVHTYTAKAGFLGRLAARIRGVPVVIHTAFNFPHLDTPSRAWLYYPLECLGTLVSDHIFCISRLGYEQALQLPVKPRHGISNPGFGIDLARFGVLLDRTSARDHLGLPSGIPIVGTAGRMVPHKRIDLFIRAARVLADSTPNIQFAVVGQGELYSSIVALTRDLGLSKRVHFLGYIGDNDMVKFMAALDVFMLPTRREGFGMVFLEAMAQETPAVAPRIRPIDDIVIDGTMGFLVDPDDPEAYARAAMELLTSVGLRERMGRQARVWVMDKFDQRRAFEKTEATYRQLLEASHEHDGS